MTATFPKRRKLGHELKPGAALDKGEPNPSIHEYGAIKSSEVHTSDADALQAKFLLPRSERRGGEDVGVLLAARSCKSNLFQLQVDEMLAEARPKYERLFGGAEDTLRRLKEIIEQVPERDALNVSEATKSLKQSHKIAVPYPDPKPPTDASYKLAYARPASVNVSGSYAYRTMAKSDKRLSIDMIVTMPAALFQEKDYLNYRYFYKRSYYLACMSAGVQDALQDNLSLRFECLGGNDLQPILVVKFKPASEEEESRKKTYEIHVIPTAPESFFLKDKLRPTKNSIRGKDKSVGVMTLLSPTPFYNSSLQADCNFERYLQLIHSLTKSSKSFTDSCLLGRIWLRQRGLGGSIFEGGFGNFEWSAITALLLKGGGSKGRSVLTADSSSYQMFKGVIQFLSEFDLLSKPLIYQSEDFSIPKSGFPVFYDGPRDHNILYKMTPWSYKRLQDEAQISLVMLNNTTFDLFDSMFILRESAPLLRYDSIVLTSPPEQPWKTNSTDHALPIMEFSKRAYDVLREGLGDRVRAIDIIASDVVPWSLKSHRSPMLHDQALVIAAIFDPTNIGRVVDYGPPAEEKAKAVRFQEFWGEKAELRRFKDGTILESVIWPLGTVSLMFETIVTHIFTRHLGHGAWNPIRFVGQNFEKMISAPETYGESFTALRLAFDTFEKEIRDLEGLPLHLRQLSAVSAQLRSSSIIVPHFSPSQPLPTPADVLMQFEGSGRWPDDVVAIQRTKIALLLKVRSLLETSNGGITARLGLENESQPLRNSSFLDVSYPSGAVFRLRIQSDREQILFERQIEDKNSNTRLRENAALSLSLYKRQFIQLPLHTRAISTHSTRFPILSATIRLMKLWFDKHMLSPHFSEELIELIVVRVFLQPYPWRTPSSTMTGFLRTLQFISRWDWRLVPLIVDFSGTMSTDDVAAISTRLTAWRKIDPGMNRTVIIAATNHDMTGTVFTDAGPTKMAASRMTTLARSACKLVKDQGINLDHLTLFESPISDYDFTIHIASKFVFGGTLRRSKQQKFKNLEMQAKANLETVGYQPVRLFLEDVQRLYTPSIVFFHSSPSTAIIGGLWNPQTAIQRPFKVNSAHATKVAISVPNDSEDLVELDKLAVLAEIGRLGGDVIAKIEIK